MANVAKFLTEAKGELKKVVWPKKEEIIRLTTVVVLASALVGFFLAGADLIFSRLIRLIAGY